MKFPFKYNMPTIINFIFGAIALVFYTPTLLSEETSPIEQNKTAVTYTPEILPKLLDHVKKTVALGATPVVIFDLDDTLINTRERNLRILQDFAKQSAIQDAYPKEVKTIESLRLNNLKWTIEATLQNAGIVNPSFIDKAKLFWASTFFTNKYCLSDEPNPGAVAYVQSLYTAGAKIVYLTGRSIQLMGSGTRKNLKKLGFPLKGERAILLMNPTDQQADLTFKQSQIPKIEKMGTIVAYLDNTPTMVNFFQKALPCATIVFLDTINPPGEPLPNPGIFWVKNFSY
jgi:hypothetical protein